MALKKVCNKAGCNRLIDTHVRYCDKHSDVEHEQEAERQKHYDMYKRDQKSKKFYDSVEWRTTRTAALVRDNYLCKECLDEKKITSYDVVDHIVPIKVDWSLRLTLSNLRSLCHGHHAIKTAEDKIKYRI